MGSWASPFPLTAGELCCHGIDLAPRDAGDGCRQPARCDLLARSPALWQQRGKVGHGGGSGGHCGVGEQRCWPPLSSPGALCTSGSLVPVQLPVLMGRLMVVMSGGRSQPGPGELRPQLSHRPSSPFPHLAGSCGCSPCAWPATPQGTPSQILPGLGGIPMVGELSMAGGEEHRLLPGRSGFGVAHLCPVSHGLCWGGGWVGAGGLLGLLLPALALPPPVLPGLAPSFCGLPPPPPNPR